MQLVQLPDYLQHNSITKEFRWLDTEAQSKK